jgi:hypothetical protein
MKTFLHGPAGTGKTTHGVARMFELSANTYDGILVYVPQKTLAGPYYDAIQKLVGNEPDILTIGGLSARMVKLFWPMISGEAGFHHPEDEPTFLNLETAQYFMAQVVSPLLQEGLFNSVTLQRNRLYTQILDNLNKAALNGYGLDTLGERLQLGDIGDPEQVRIYDDALASANAFRDFCLKHNLIDFSLLLELFTKFLWPAGMAGRAWIEHEYRHVIVDNLEETTPVEHDIFRDWLPNLESALLIYDEDAGYRSFLGADPTSAKGLRDFCDHQQKLDVASDIRPVLQNVLHRFGHVLKRSGWVIPEAITSEQLREGLQVELVRYFPEMLDRVAERISALIKEGVPLSEIVVLSPYLSDALRYSLTDKLQDYGIQVRSHRPSRSLRDEPVSRALVTLAKLAHPDWEMTPSRFDLTYACLQIFDDIDLVRAQLLSEAVYDDRARKPSIKPFDTISLGLRDRITYSLGRRFDWLRDWLENYLSGEPVPLDHFISRLFGEVLSQPGFGFHGRLSVGEITANLVDSIQNFRWMNEGILESYDQIGREYVRMMEEGVIAAQYIRSWQVLPEEAVLIAPAYTFLMRNQAVDFQFWLDIGSHGWHERVYQPLTHPYVLNRNWPIDRYWTDMDEVAQGEESLYRLVSGLFRRCRKRVILARSELSETGSENRGLLIRVLQQIYQEIYSEEASY